MRLVGLIVIHKTNRINDLYIHTVELSITGENKPNEPIIYDYIENFFHYRNGLVSVATKTNGETKPFGNNCAVSICKQK